MPPHVIAVDLFSLVLAAIGFHLAFRQHLVRRWWRRFNPRDPSRPAHVEREEGEDPVHYAMMIAGMMILAFGLILASFTTAFSLMTATPPS